MDGPFPRTAALMQRSAIFRRIAIACLAVTALAIGLWQLQHATDGLAVTHSHVSQTPVTIFQPKARARAPVVIIAHGFAGSQQLMQPFAVTLARNGYNVVTFDFLGHGRNRVPMRGDITEGETITTSLVKELSQVAVFARSLPGNDGRIAVLGHSMASDIVVRFAQANTDVQATVAVSVFSPVATATSPRNLLVIVGAIEPEMLIDEGRRIVNLTAGGNAVERKTYGSFRDGSARRLVLAQGVEHIGVLYSYDSMAETLRWMNAAFERGETGYLDRRGLSLALVFLGLIALAWPLTSLLPMAADTPRGANFGWKPLLTAAFAPALLTPLILWKLPTDFLPILLGDYLALHFALYGVLTAFAVFAIDRHQPTVDAPVRRLVSWRGIAFAALAVGIYAIVGFGVPTDAYVFSFLPSPQRLLIVFAIACGTVPYFVADEWLTRGSAAKRGAYALTKFCFLLSLAIAVLLNPQKLFFLAIIVPAILLLFLAFGLICRWTYRRTNHPLAGAIANAGFFAWAIAVTFPMIVR